MGSRKRVKYTADVIDSIRSDWHISDDGYDRGPTDQWPAPFLGSDNGSNAVPTRELRRAGNRNGMRFDESSGPIPPQILPRRPGFDFDDGGLNYEDYDQGFAREAFAEERRGDALFSRTGMGGPVSAYRFLRKLDPGSDNTYAPRRGPHDVTSTSGVNAGAGFMPFSDAGDLNGTISQFHGQLIALYQRWGIWIRIAPQQNQLSLAFQQIQQAANSPSAWKQVGSAHQLAYDLATKGFGRKPTPAQGAEIEAHFKRLSQIMPGGGNFISSIGNTLGSVGKGIVSVGGGLVKTVVNVATSPVHLVSDIARGKNVLESLKDTVKRDLQSAKELAPYVQAVLSVVPGVGQGVNAAIAAGTALAHGQPITDALVAGLKGAIPGGPLAQQGLETAYNLAKGQSVTEATLNAARGQLPPGPAQQAFDTGVALAHGQKLQTALIEHGSKLLPGGESVQSAVRNIAGGGNVVTALAGVAKDQGMSFLSDAQRRLSPLAPQALSNVGPRIGQITRGALTIVPTNVKQAANALLQNPSLRSLPIATVAQRLGLPSDDVRQAVASVVQSAGRTGIGQMKPLAPANHIAERVGTHTSFDQNLARFGSRMAPIAMSPNARRLPRFRRLMPGGAMGLQDAGAFGTIKLGSTGADVQAWQKILGITADGKFGPQTDSSTRMWQKSHGLVADGVVGPKTWAAAQGSVPPAPSAPSSGPGTVTIPETVIAAAPPPPLTQAQISAAKSMPTIRTGSQGDAVKTWQGILRRDSGISGFSAAPDGQFGPITDAATRNWQRSSGLTPDGVVGPATWAKGIGSLTTAPLPAQTAPGVNMPTPVPPMLPPGLPPVPTQPAGPAAPPLSLPPILGPLPVSVTPPPTVPLPPTIGVTTAPPPTGPQTEKAGGAVAALAIGALAAKMFGIF